MTDSDTPTDPTAPPDDSEPDPSGSPEADRSGATDPEGSDGPDPEGSDAPDPGGFDDAPDRSDDSDDAPDRSDDFDDAPGESDGDATPSHVDLDPGNDVTPADVDVILVSSTTESAGKTAIAIALARAAADRGEAVGYVKPKGTRLESNVGKTLDSDPLLAREVLGLDDGVGDMEPVVYSPTFVEEAVRGREDPVEVRERVREAFGRIAEDRDRVIVEGGGAVSTGGIVELTDADVADLLDAETVLVAGYDRAGDLDPVLWAADAFQRRDRLKGVLFNAVPDSALDGLSADAVPFLEGRGIDVHGVVPRQRDLAGVTVAELAEELGAEILAGEAGADAYVERFAVGAMSAEAALRYFRRTTDVAVITGGDRAEIQTAAMEAPGVRCLVLTGGHRPSRAVLGTAEEKGVPVLSVGGDTLTVVERAETVVRSGRTRDRETVERMGELLAEHADLDALLD